MNQHSEVEAKFEAGDLRVSQIQEWLDSEANDEAAIGPVFKSEYRKIIGTDTFMSINTKWFGEKILRIRDDRDMGTGLNQVCLTVKERKSKTSLLDRKEIDLLVAGSDGEDAKAFFRMLSATEEFVLGKSYHVWKIQYGPYDACLALYDVGIVAPGKDTRSSDISRFLEIEIDRHSTCSESEGYLELVRWVTLLQKQFGLNAPVNYSLYEKYRPYSLKEFTFRSVK